MSRSSEVPRERTAPPCRHFGRCGGCTTLDRPIDEQLATKLALAHASLVPFVAAGSIAVDPPPRVPRFSRQKLLYPIQPDRGRSLRGGLYRAGTHEIIPIEECQTQDPALTRLGRRALDIFRRHRLRAYDERDQTGFLRAFQARIMPGTGELLIGIVTAGGTFPEGAEIAADLRDAAASLRDQRGRRLTTIGVVRNIQDRPGNALIGPRTVPLSGRDYQEDRVGPLTIRVSFGSFYQVHRHSDRVLYQPALAMVGDVRGLSIVDGYGGVGPFALRLAHAGAGRVDLIESAKSACRDARSNVDRNRLTSIHVHEAPFGSEPLARDVDLLVVDPPRAGLGAAVSAVLAAAPRRILYVACALRALRVDLEQLCAAGAYRVARTALVDLFPHTDHVEIVALLERAD